MKCIALAVVLTLAVGCHSATNCHWGPSYWCLSKENAKECGGTQYCEDNAWKKPASTVAMVKAPQGFECDVCKLVVQFIDGQLLKNSTEAEVEAAMKGFCSSTGPLSDLCESFVDEYFDQIWQLLVNKASPDSVCSELSVCSSKKTTPTVAMVKSPQGIECEACKLVVQFADGELDKNSTEQEVKVALGAFCNDTGPFSGACTTFVNEYFDEVWQLLISSTSPDTICSAIGLCASRLMLATKVKPHPLKASANPVVCDGCKMIAKEVMNLVENNVTEHEAKVEIKKVCIYMGGFAGECRRIIDDFFDEIWQAAKKAIGDPTLICQKIQLCAAKVSRTTTLKKMAPQQGLCDICKLAASFLKPYVDSNATETEVKDALEGVCKLLPGNASTECTSLVDTYFDFIWELVKSEIDSGEVCKQLGLCNDTRRGSFKTQPRPQAKPHLQAKDNPLCPICQMVVTFVKPYVDDNSTESEVKAGLETFCGLLPSSISDECTTLVDQYFPLIWMLLKSEVDSGEVCDQLGFCNSTKKYMKLAAKPVKVLKGAACDMCNLVVNFVKPYVDSNSTEQEVKSALEAICNLLPSGVKGECSSLVDQYFDLVWLLLKSEVDSGEVCQQIGLCNSTKTLQKLSVSADVRSAGTCSACKLVVSYLKVIVDSNFTESEAKALVEKVCNEAGPLKGECDSLIDQYFPMIWMLIQSYVDDDQICAEIKLCSSSSNIEKPASTVVEIQKAKSSVGGVFCMVCELVMKEVTSLLDGNTTKQAIEDALDKVCDVLPSSVQSDCTEFVNKYAPEIIDLILSGTAAKAVCTALGLCLAEEPQLQTVGGEVECEVCTSVLMLAKTLIGTKGAEGTAEKVLEDVCKLVPSGIRSECKVFVDTFGPQVIELLDKAINPQAICTEIKLCAKTVPLYQSNRMTRKY